MGFNSGFKGLIVS